MGGTRVDIRRGGSSRGVCYGEDDVSWELHDGGVHESGIAIY